MTEERAWAMTDDPYEDWDRTSPPPERPVDPTRAARVLSSRCTGYQTEDRTAEGRVTRTIWSGIIEFDDHHTDIRYWLDGGGATEYLELMPRIDRPMPDRPAGQS